MDFPGEKVVIKFWETLTEKGIGGLLGPWQEERMGKARNRVKRDEILMLAQAEKLASDLSSGRASYSNQASLKRISHKPEARVEPTIRLEDFAEYAMRQDAAESIRKEINVCKAVLISEDVLSQKNQEPPIADIDDDWICAWREYAGRVSSSELQELWGKVLAGEFQSPGTYSFRALEFIKSISRAEAEMISKAARFVIGDRILRNKGEFLEKEGVTFSTLLRLQEIGVLSGVESSGLKTTWGSVETERYVRPLVSNRKVLIIEHDDINNKLVSEVYKLTSVGRQVLELASFGSDIDYLKSYAKECVIKGYTVMLADWEPNPDGTGTYYNGINIVGD